jgi:phage/conjugal plasmid C-4 type zinc finger TraR family protein
MDDADRAQQQDELLSAVALATRQAPQRPSARDCEGCGKVIPEGRRRAVAGCQTCITCQEAIERAPR